MLKRDRARKTEIQLHYFAKSAFYVALVAHPTYLLPPATNLRRPPASAIPVRADLVGFADGTAPPVGNELSEAATFNATDPEVPGGSYVPIQKYLYDLNAGWRTSTYQDEDRSKDLHTLALKREAVRLARKGARLSA